MWSGTTSVGSATSSSGNSGKSWASRSAATESRPAGGEQQVVEQRRRQPRLEHPLVELLQQQVAVERVALPQQRPIVGIGARPRGRVEPAEPVRAQLLAADRDVREAGAVREGGEVVGHERVDVDERLEVVAVVV